VADSLEAANFDFAFYVLSYISSEISLNGVVLINEVAYFDNFLVREVADTRGPTDIEGFAYI